ncbi:citrate lyase subunit beta-like protein [Rhizoctonia solani AG-1 IB]|uniref:Citrate lyase subunit beta-like protein n=1 Tax=Thanatephorus cucumeris (strain AG1-IB / isolate 7/3/14) TaxID=1108050 RepID=A0A0B7FMD5_THACB|nr:citrate lyase subunit beta-like protein [Rhizoctonia solani AG-1 IB]
MLARLGAFKRGVGVRSYSVSSYTDARSKLQRSLLYVPSSNDRMLQKSLSSPSDALIYDLEDSVAPNEKERARTALLGFLQSQPPEHASRTLVRLNAIDTPQFVDDITTVLKWEHLQGIVMPKIHSASYLDQVASYVPEGRPLNIIASIESARGLWDAGHIAGWKAGQGSGNKVAVSSLLFAAEDYCADTRIIRTQTRQELLYPRSQMATAAKAFGVQCIDMVCVNYKDTTVLRDECEEARRLGYDGKQAIHPNQVEIIQSTFVPTEKEITRAAKIISQMARSHASSTGAFGLDSGSGNVEMIDAPMLKQAETTIANAKAAGLKIPDV